MDDNYRVERVKSQDARAAIDAVLAGREVADPYGRIRLLHQVEGERRPPRRCRSSKPAGEAGTGLRRRPEETARQSHRQVTLVSFWATWCGSCIHGDADIETTYRMYAAAISTW